MQSASDIFLGWTRSSYGFDFFVRQLRDMKFSMTVEAAPIVRDIVRRQEFVKRAASGTAKASLE